MAIVIKKEGSAKTVDGVFEVMGAKFHCAEIPKRILEVWNDEHTRVSKKRETRGQEKLDVKAVEKKVLEYSILGWDHIVDESGTAIPFAVGSIIPVVSSLSAEICGDMMDFILALKATTDEAPGDPQN